MKRKRIDLFQERQIITYMIINSDFLRRIVPVVKPKYFESIYGRLVSEWVIEYFNEFKEAPEKHIQDIYNRKSKFIREEEEVEIVKEFLLQLSKDWEKQKKIQNIDFVIKNSIHFLKIRSIFLLKNKLESALLDSDPLGAESEIANFSRVESSATEGISILKDDRKICAAFLSEEEYMFSFPGVLGEIIGPFMRGDLAAFLAFAKRGKTWWQWYVGQLAMYFGFKVVFFTLEMTENQIIRRGWISLTAQSRKSMELNIPYFSKIDEEDEKSKWEVLFKKEKKEGVDLPNIKKLQQHFRKQFRSGGIKIIPLLAYSATVEDIEAHLDNMYYYEEYIPDVVIIDYADIIAPSKSWNEYRHQIDDIWKKLRRIAQERNILMVTASQAGRRASKKDATEETIVEDIRKIAHTSKMVSINSDLEDQKLSACRIAQLAERDGRRNYRQALVLQCLSIGRPYLDSRYNDEVER